MENLKILYRISEIGVLASSTVCYFRQYPVGIHLSTCYLKGYARFLKLRHLLCSVEQEHLTLLLFLQAQDNFLLFCLAEPLEWKPKKGKEQDSIALILFSISLQLNTSYMKGQMTLFQT